MTDEQHQEYSPGLADVVAAETRLSRVDGNNGRLVIAGYDIEELAEQYGFEEIVGKLMGRDAPDLGPARVKAFADLADCALEQDDSMDAIRAALGCTPSTGSFEDDAKRALATVPVAVAAWWSFQRGDPPTPPDETLGHAADYLRMVTGEASGDEARSLERYLVTVSDHGLNASTFTARVIASTRSDLISATAGAVGALKGPLHGGAPGPVLEMFDAIGTADRAETWLREELEAGNRIMGMGHRVYRVRDPRAAVFEETVAALSESAGSPGRIDLAAEVEQAAEEVLAEKYPDRELRANVEFYTAVLLEAVGLPRELFSATFAVGRMAGWCGHVLEQRDQDTLIRPRARYLGETPDSTP